MIKRYCTAWLAEVIKLACPWYLRALIFRKISKGVVPLLLLMCMALLVMFPRLGDNALHHASRPLKLIWPEIRRNFIRQFPTPEGLAHRVAFWKAVFSRYSGRHAVIYDSRHYQVVYEALDVKTSPGIKATVQKYRRILRTLDRKQRAQQLDDLTVDERRVYELFEEVNEADKFKKAASSRMKIQFGQREHLLQAIRRAGLYQKKFEEIFHKHNIPIELIWLPVVESYFKYSAYSSAGAAGVWQFMPATARMYGLKINYNVDERYDPFKAADAAARLLKANYRIFSSWPLAVTSYNHGPAGVLRAVKQLRTKDLGKIVNEYRGARFGFYSSNYYAEFLAVAQIMQDPAAHFGPIEQHAPLEYESVNVNRRIFLRDLVEHLAVPHETLLMLNRDLKQAITQSKVPLPQNFELKLPPGRKSAFLAYCRTL